jgi:O-antigen ligase
MVLVLFTEPDPEEAIIRSIKRCAYVIFPVSILWIKYYTALGRKFDEWGAMTSVGIAGGKNELGAVCLFMGAFLLWRWLRIRRADKTRARRDELWLLTFLLSTIAYALWKAHSGTSTICFLLAVGVIFGLELRAVDKRIIGYYLAMLCVAAIAAQLLFDVYGKVVDLSGHESTIEGRGRLWEVLLQTDHDPVLGVGYESYWLGERLQRIWDMPEFRWHPTQAHNGYIETYINLGAVGLIMLVGVILAAFRKCLEELRRDFEWGRIMLACLIAIVAHNWTEAGFKALDTVFFFFFLVSLRYPWKSIVMTPPGETNKRSWLELDEAVYAETGI